MLYCDLRRPSRFRTALEDLNCANTVAGYPDAGSIDVPNPERSVAKADDLLQWIGKQSTMYPTSSGGYSSGSRAGGKSRSRRSSCSARGRGTTTDPKATSTLSSSRPISRRTRLRTAETVLPSVELRAAPGLGTDPLDARGGRRTEAITATHRPNCRQRGRLDRVVVARALPGRNVHRVWVAVRRVRSRSQGLHEFGQSAVPALRSRPLAAPVRGLVSDGNDHLAPRRGSSGEPWRRPERKASAESGVISTTR